MKKYNLCPFTQYKYDARSAQKAADYKLVTSRQGLNMSEADHHHLDRVIKEGVDDGQSVYLIVKHNPEINTSVPTVYRLINNHQLSTKRIDLPYATYARK